MREMNGTQPTENVLWLFSRVFMAPLSVFVYGVEVFFKAVQEAQRAAHQGIEALVSAPAGWNPVPESPAVQAVSGDSEMHFTSDSSDTSKIQAIGKEDKTLNTEISNCCNDRNLHDDLLKLVRFKILFVKRDYEYAFPEQEELVPDNMDGSAFTAWKIAQFIQDLHRGDTPVPRKWLETNYPPRNFREDCKDDRRHQCLTGLPHEDKKYLRVFYQVLDRYPRERFKYE